MDAFTTRTHRAVLEVMAGPVEDRRGGKYFNASYIAANDYGEKFMYPGMVIAESGSYYVPYNVSAAYGTGSDTAVGILREMQDVTVQTTIVAPVTMGAVIEDYIYVYGSALDTVTTAIKTDLPHIRWK